MKVWQRTENGTTTHVTVTEGLKEINHAMTDGKRDVRTMSSGNRGWFIEYKDGRSVRFVRVDVDDSVMEPKPVETEAEEWGSSRSSFTLHKFYGDGPAVPGADYRAKCNRGIRWYARPLTQTEGPRLQTRTELEADEYAHLNDFCPKCEAK